MHQSIALPSVELINIEATSFSPLISKCSIKVCYVGDEPNRNKSVITKDVAREMAASLRGAPIVGFYNESSGDFEEHNRVIDISNGSFEIKDTTRPYGFVDLNARCWFQEFDDEGVVHEYLMTEGWLWTGQYKEAQRIIEHGNNQSMELDDKLIDAHWTKDANGKPQFFIIDEAIISKLCILGENCEPCFEGSQITKIQFSFEDGFKDNLFSLIKEMTQIIKEGGTPVFTTYAVEIGDSLWNSLYDYLVSAYPEEECDFCSIYRIEGVYEEEGQKFAILQNRSTTAYYRMNFSLTEEGVTFDSVLTEVEKEFIPTEAQFDSAAVEAYELEYAKKDEKKEDKDEEEEVCEKCGKPVSECDCDDEEEEEDKKKYNLDEISEYVELTSKYSELETENANLKNSIATLEGEKAALEAQLNDLTEFKLKAERAEKYAMIKNTFYMLSDDLKKEVVDNIDSYSLEEIESKLSVICVRNKVSFNLEEEEEGRKEEEYNFHLGDLPDDSNLPAWIRAVLDKQKTM